MIQLPDNYLETARVEENVLWLHFVNDAAQFWTYRATIDPAISAEEQLKMLEDSLTADSLKNAQAYTLNPDLTTNHVDAADQNWKPAPITAANGLSMPQWRALKGLPSA